jgi:hypothetical protein
MPRNNTAWGWLMGIVIPVFGFILYYALKFLPFDIGFMEYVHTVTSRLLLPKVVSLSIIANLPLFLYYYNRRCERSAKGVLFATGMYGLVIVITKFFL